MSDFQENSDFRQKGTKVTIYSDEGGLHPRRIGLVKRIGNGAWRLGGCSEWYDFNGKRVAVDETGPCGNYDTTTCFARLYREGDEAAITVEDERVKKHKELLSGKSTLEWRIRLERNSIQSNIQFAERGVSYARERVRETEQRFNNARHELERALAVLAKLADNNDHHTKAIADNEAKLAFIEAELARFDTEW